MEFAMISRHNLSCGLSIAARLTGLWFVGASSSANVMAQGVEHRRELANDHFQVEVNETSGGVMRLSHPLDGGRLNYVMGAEVYPWLDVEDSRWLGDLIVRYRAGLGTWQLATTGRSREGRRIEKRVSRNQITVSYPEIKAADGRGPGIALTQTYRLEGDHLEWTIRIENRSSVPVEIGDLGLPLPFNTCYARNPRTTYEERVVRHSQIAGDNSFVLLVRANGQGPFLLMTPDARTQLEYFDRSTQETRANADPAIFGGQRAGTGNVWEGLYTAYIHASVQAVEVESRGTWNQPLTNRCLKASGQPGDAATYAFKFQWVRDYAAARQALVNEGLLDIQVSPGMVIPSDLPALLSIGAQEEIESITAQYPGETTIAAVASPQPLRRNWRIGFRRLGENKIFVRWGGGRKTAIEYFVTEPLDVLIAKRAAFLVKNQQVRGTDKWYEGLFSLWDMKEGKLLTPDDSGGLVPYMVGGADDPGLGKAPFVASKNVIYPDTEEIGAVEYYLKNFVWGKLQRTDQEQPFPYGIYGSPNWHENRRSASGYGSGGLGQERMWRTFDYTHLIQLYYQMHRIARVYPDLVHYLDASGYLDRAYRTAMAFFEVPYQIKMGSRWNFQGWTDWAYKQGAFHELYIPPLIEALEREGRPEQAAKLRHEWEKKVKYVIYDDPYPFGSEMYFDTTAYQSMQALARYGLDHPMQPDENLWTDKNSGAVYSHPSIKHGDFTTAMERSLQANLAARGWLESSYYLLGSDYRQHGNTDYTLSYMTQMGGGAILDYALHAERPAPELLRLGFASYLGSWALVNSGTPASGYGYWAKGPQHDGAAGWGFKPEKFGRTSWLPAAFAQGRGAFRHDGEIDNGFSDALLSAATIVSEDPVFGPIALGGDLQVLPDTLQVTPKDGVRQKLFVRQGNLRLDLTLDRDGFASSQPIRIDRRGGRLEFTLHSRSPQPHSTTLIVRGLTPGRYRMTFAEHDRRFEADSEPLIISLPVGPAASYPVILCRIESP
jgi:hypothetical protein